MRQGLRLLPFAGAALPPVAGEIAIALGVSARGLIVVASIIAAAILCYAGVRVGAASRESFPAPVSIGPVSISPAADRQRLVGRLAGGVAHDFNNLLATVLGCLELMERRAGDPERLQSLIKRACDAVERAARLTSGLVHFARRQPEPPSPVSLPEAVEGLTPLIGSALGRRIRFTADARPETPLVEGDLASVESCLTALCLAARDTLPDGGEVVLSTQAGPQVGAPDPSDAPAPHAVVIVRAQGPQLADWDTELLTRCANSLKAYIRLGPESNEISLFFPASPMTTTQGVR